MTLGDLLRFTVESLERLQITYAIVGSFASGIWGEPRMTRDIDIVVRLTTDRVPSFCEAFPLDQFYLSRSAIEEAISYHRPFNVIHPDSGIKVDFMVLAEDGWNNAQITRRIELEILPGLTGFVAAPEDVILGKLAYCQEGHSEKHLHDIAGILKTSGGEVDRAYIDQYARELGVVDLWQSLQQQLGSL